MVLMYLSKRLRRAAISAILGYVYIPRCTVRHRMYTLRGMDCSDIHIPIRVLYPDFVVEEILQKVVDQDFC